MRYYIVMEDGTTYCTPNKAVADLAAEDDYCIRVIDTEENRLIVESGELDIKPIKEIDKSYFDQ